MGDAERTAALLLAGADRIKKLKAELAARDAEIGTWRRTAEKLEAELAALRKRIDDARAYMDSFSGKDWSPSHTRIFDILRDPPAEGDAR